MASPQHYFKNRTVVIATKHRKEQVIAPLLQKYLEVNWFVPEKFNTDSFGTFTGEIERREEPISTLRNKCLKAMETYNCDLGVASEGSFGNHPNLFFSYADEELVILIDKKNNLEILARMLSVETNFNGAEIASVNDLKLFAQKTLFPSHALILRNQKMSNKKIIKGITSWDRLVESFKQIKNEFGSVYAETDMRAMYNPTRMKIIKRATENLIDLINSQCPNCDMPGFSIKEIRRGLPCNFCNSPTNSVISHIFSCSRCAFTEEKIYPDNRKFEDRMYCDLCNP